MAVVAEELISDLIVRDGKLRSGIRSAQQAYGAGIGSMRNDTKRFESEFNRSSSNVSDGFKRMAGTLAAGVSLAATSQLIDSYTRLQNSLRVAGLEGEKLQSVQNDLLALSTKYGVNIEGLANLYGKASDAGKSFGASQAQILQLTEATSQSLLITGTRAEQASGAILGLSQALASGTVRAEEFNQINEGGLRPLLQAAAATERFGGDVNKLRAAVLDGKLSSQEFFNAIMAGSAQLEGQAAKATLTLSGAFEALNSSLTVYVGSAASANGVTGALAAAIGKLAENLDTIIPALATIAGIIAVRYVSGLITATAASIALRASTTGLTLSLGGLGAAATLAGRSLLAAFGGPVGVAIIALGAGLAYLATSTDEAVEAARQAELQATRTAAAQQIERQATELLAQAKGRERAEQIAATKASRDRAAQALQTAKALQAEARAALVLARAEAQKTYERSAGDTSFLATLGRGLGGAGGAGPTITPGTAQATKLDRAADSAQAELDRADKAISELEGVVEGLSSAITAAATAPALAATGTSATGGRGSRASGGGRSGPSAAEIDERFAREIEQYTQQILTARQSIATSAAEEADLARRSLEVSRRAALAELESNTEYDSARKAQLREYIERLAAVEEETIAVREAARAESERAEVARAEYDVAREALQFASDMADTQAERREIALELIEIGARQRRAELEALKQTEGLSDARRRAVQIELDALGASTTREQNRARRDTENPLEKLSRESNLTADQMNEAFQSIQADGLTALSDGITDVIMQTRSLGDVFKSVANQIIADLIRIAVQKFIVNSLVNVAGSLFGGGGGFGGSSLGGGLAGARAGGGPVRAGQLYRVNEGQQEFFRPATDGRVVPLSQAQAARPTSGAGAAPVVVQLAVAPGEMFVPIVEGISGNVAVRTVQATAPGLVRAATNETMRRAGRPRT